VQVCWPTGSVVSNGFELAAQVIVTERVKTTLALAYTDTHHTQTIKAGNAVIVLEGDPLDVSSPWTQRRLSNTDSA